MAEKARFAAAAVWAGIPGGRGAFAETAEDLSGDLTGGGMAYLRLAVRGEDEQAVGRAFSGAVVETSLSSYPGTFFTSAPSGAQGVARYWPTTVAASAVTPHVECEGTVVEPTAAPSTERDAGAGEPLPPPPGTDTDTDTGTGTAAGTGERTRVPLGVLLGARSGDKGGDANVGVWADEDDVAKWLQSEFTTETFRALLPELAGFEVDRYPLPNLRAVNFVVHGILGWGVASNLRLDTQAKGLGERLRSRPVEVPVALVASGKPAQRLTARTEDRPHPH